MNLLDNSIEVYKQEVRFARSRSHFETLENGLALVGDHNPSSSVLVVSGARSARINRRTASLDGSG
jgi:hypothetical protein